MNSTGGAQVRAESDINRVGGAYMVSLPGVMRTPFCHGHEIAALPRHLSWIITIIHEI